MNIAAPTLIGEPRTSARIWTRAFRASHVRGYWTVLCKTELVPLCHNRFLSPIYIPCIPRHR